MATTNGRSRTLWRVIGFAIGVVAVLGFFGSEPGRQLLDRAGGAERPESVATGSSADIGAVDGEAAIEMPRPEDAAVSLREMPDDERLPGDVEAAGQATGEMMVEVVGEPEALLVPESDGMPGAVPVASVDALEPASDVADPDPFSSGGEGSDAEASPSTVGTDDNATAEALDLLDDDPPVEADRVTIASDEGDRWSPVWRAFASERTAAGFAEYIGEATGLDLRVGTSSASGTYPVEVAHRTDAEFEAAVERIVQATGYRPPETSR